MSNRVDELWPIGWPKHESLVWFELEAAFRIGTGSSTMRSSSASTLGSRRVDVFLWLVTVPSDLQQLAALLIAVRQAQPSSKLSAALYIYSVHSPFVHVVNDYMTSGRAIVPPHSEAQFISSFGDYSSWINNQSMKPSLSIPTTAVNVTFLDRTD